MLDPNMKTDRFEARLAAEERALLIQAASLSGDVPLSRFVVDAAVGAARQIVEHASTTIVPADYFDALVEALDRPDPARNLDRAANRARAAGRIPIPE